MCTTLCPVPSKTSCIRQHVHEQNILFFSSFLTKLLHCLLALLFNGTTVYSSGLFFFLKIRCLFLKQSSCRPCRKGPAAGHSALLITQAVASEAEPGNYQMARGRQEVKKKDVSNWDCKWSLGWQIVIKLIRIQTWLPSSHPALLRSVKQSLIINGLFLYTLIILKMLSNVWCIKS